MRWILLLVGITLHSLVIAQSTLKIYVVDDDLRSDMDIIDLNTSALERYGKSVDSTNINFYATTMSTQVLRMSKIDLFGPEEEQVEALADEEISIKEDKVTGSGSSDSAGSNVVRSAEASPREKPSVSRSSSSSSGSSGSVSSNSSPSGSRSYAPSKKGKRPKKSRRNRKYKGQCPRFF